jgi:hypothetical protein
MAEDYGYGLMALNLAPEIKAEDRIWRFIGIQAKNCKEWLITHFANMT